MAPSSAGVRTVIWLTLLGAGAALAGGPPSIEGMWTNGTLTPLERPPQFADKPFLTPAERAALQPQAAEKFWAAGHRKEDVGRDNDAFLDDDLELLPNGQTSLVVEPANGLAPLTATAERLRDANLRSFDSYETMSQWDRCITRFPTALFPLIYNNAVQIVQTPTHVVMISEMVHDARIIPLGKRAHVDARVTSWEGDSRGWWEGDSLIVETRNFNGRGWLTTAMSAGRVRGVPFTQELRTIERFTRVDEHTLAYEITIHDPQMFAAPWKVSYPMLRDDDYQMFEYACHEGNSAVELILRGARVQEQARAAER